MDHVQAHPGDNARSARPHMGGLTIALLLVTALASLPAESFGAGRMAERAARAARTLQSDTILSAGFDFVVLATLATAEAPHWLDQHPAERDLDRATDAPPIDRSADVAAGLMNLPPPAAM